MSRRTNRITSVPLGLPSDTTPLNRNGIRRQSRKPSLADIIMPPYQQPQPTQQSHPSLSGQSQSHSQSQSSFKGNYRKEGTSSSSAAANPLLVMLLTAPRISPPVVLRVLASLSSDPRARIKLLVGLEGAAALADWNLSCPPSGLPEAIEVMRLETTAAASGVFPVCRAWKEMALRACSALGADLVCFYGDDVEMLLPSEFYGEVCEGFRAISDAAGAPFPIGCVVLREERAPGWPSFPVIAAREHLRHHGDFFDDSFVNQGADPYLFELYDRQGLARYTNSIVIRNGNGGVTGGLDSSVQPPTYEPTSIEWRTAILRRALQASSRGSRQLAVTVCTPVHRISGDDLSETQAQLQRILDLEVPKDVSVKFSWIIDNPEALDNSASAREWFREREVSDSRLRIRVNAGNLGAAESRTRGWEECHSDWVLFIDDDVEVTSSLLTEYAECIRDAPDVSGYVGVTRLGVNDGIAANAVHFAQTSFFWHIAENVDGDVPWGVTANIMLRWCPGPTFDNRFPKTGGGEDIDFCMKVRDTWLLPLRPAPNAVVSHPWWDEGRLQSLVLRHYKWARGDGLLTSIHPEHSYLSFPNCVELSATAGLAAGLVGAFEVPVAIVVGEILATIIWVVLKREADFAWTISRVPCDSTMALSILCSAALRNASRFGQFCTHICGGKWWCIGRRFRWFLGIGAIGRSEVYDGRVREGLHVMIMAIVYAAIVCLV